MLCDSAQRNLKFEPLPGRCRGLCTVLYSHFCAISPESSPRLKWPLSRRPGGLRSSRGLLFDCWVCLRARRHICTRGLIGQLEPLR